MANVGEVIKAFLDDDNDPRIPQPTYDSVLAASSDMMVDMTMLHGSVMAGNPSREWAIYMVHKSIHFLADNFE